MPVWNVVGVLFIIGCNMNDVWSWIFWYGIMASTGQVLFYKFCVMKKYWFAGVLRDLDMGLKLLFWYYKLDFWFTSIKYLIFKGLRWFFGWLVVIFDGWKVGRCLILLSFVEVGIEVKMVKMCWCGTCGKCMGRVGDVWVEHMTMILKIGMIPKM